MIKKSLIGLLLIAAIGCLGGCAGDSGASEAVKEPNIEETSSETVSSESEEAVDDTDLQSDDVEIADGAKNVDNNDTDSQEAESDESDDIDENDEKKVETIMYTAEELENMDSVDFAPIMQFGWNLGNTLDANSKKGLESETCWNQPKATQDLFSYVKAVGFTSVRIPVSWGNHVDENYKIDDEWMARVKEVVDYAYNQDMFVIINSHHDNDYYYPSDAHYNESEKFLTTIWEQIAEEFKDYDNRLVFESMNEPRLSGTDIEWWFPMSDIEGKKAIVNICKLNQAFVDTVRATGGRNANRFLMVPSYAANPDFAHFNEFSMPEDTANNKLILSVHAYTPYDFAGNGSGYREWDGSKNYEFNFMGKLKAMFINEGYGVVIGEFGATNKGNDQDRIRWAKGYTQKAASFGISYFIWDNGGTDVGEENFGVINREKLFLDYPDLFDAYMSGFQVYPVNK